jgi:hypothetical protein
MSMLRRFLIDLLAITFVMVAYLFVMDRDWRDAQVAQGATPTKAEKRAARHAREAIYESCVATCSMGCAK